MRMKIRKRNGRWLPSVALVFTLLLVSAFAVNFLSTLSQASGSAPIDWLGFMRTRRQGMEYLADSVLESHGRLVNVDGLVEEFGTDVLLPAWLPEGMLPRRIVILEDVAFIAYSDREITGLREAQLTITIVRNVIVPTKEQLAEQATRVGNKLVQVGQVWGVLCESTEGFSVTVHDGSVLVFQGWENEPQPAFLYFWSGSKYYLIRGSLSEDVLVKVADQMR